MNGPEPSLIGYPPDEAERVAAARGFPVVWLDPATPRWLAPTREGRVGRQRLRPDGTLELLRVQIPVATDE